MKLLTNNGKRRIKQYLAGFVPTLGTTLAFGVAADAESATSTSMGFEVGRVNIHLTTYDFLGDKLIFKGTIPAELGCKVYEVGLFSSAPSFGAVGTDSRLLTSFVPLVERWLDASGLDVPSTAGTVSRFGDESLRLTPAASASSTITLDFSPENLSGFSGTDKIAVAFNAGNVNTNNIEIRFHTTANDYFRATLGAQTAGYKVVKVNKSSLVAVGAPDWSSISRYTVIVTSKASGASQIDLDALKIQKDDVLVEESILIARKTLATPFTKEVGQTHDIEFALTINV